MQNQIIMEIYNFPAIIKDTVEIIKTFVCNKHIEKLKKK